MGNFKLGKNKQLDYLEVYEDLNKRRMEDKSVEEAWMNLITTERYEKKTFSSSNQIRRKHSIQKIINIFKKL